MRKSAVFWALVLGACWWGLARAQETAGEIHYMRFRRFNIPIPQQNLSRFRQLQLYMSVDEGKSWQPYAVAPPDKRSFEFVATRDGPHWFTVQTQDQQGQTFPPTMEGAQPSLKVVIDTQPPVIILQPLPPRGSEVGVSWEVRDENPDLVLPDAVRLEYRRGGAGEWFPLQRPASGSQLYWSPQTNAPVQVRLRARDRAGNWGEATTTVSLNGNQDFVGGNDTPEVFQGPAPEERKLVNSKRISLNYEVKETGPSGVSTIELWYTQDGRSWNRYPQNATQEASARPFVFDVTGEGLYGITLVAKSGVGLGVRPPQLGDRPQIWIEVDLTKPIVQIKSVTVGQGADKGKLFINWSARDKNMAQSPIAISYGEQATGPWTPIAEHQANTGRYTWTIPERGVPYQFFVRVETRDLAGNVGEAITPQMVKVDLSQPRVNIINIEPGR